MKKVYSILLVVACVAAGDLKGQNRDYKWGLGVHAGIFESNGNVGSDFFTFENPTIAPALSVSRYITSSWDVEAMASFGTISYQSVNNTRIGADLFNLNVYGKFKFYNGKILKEDAILGPFLFAGFGDAYVNNGIYNGLDFNFPLGLGVKVRMGQRVNLVLQSTYTWSVSDNYDNVVSLRYPYGDQFLYHSAGLVFNLGKKDTDRDGVSDKSDKCPGTIALVKVDGFGCPLDSDKDGVADVDDACPAIAGSGAARGCPDKDGDGLRDQDDSCPEVKGIIAMNGCPDSDGDGITDALDSCPEVNGIVAMNGCPDSDGDGVVDSKDKCPQQAGSITTQGCPDSDNDLVADINDACPQVAGTITNNGCPEVSKEDSKVMEDALVGVQFESGKDVILKKSYAVLDNVARVMSAHPEYKLEINGHTDNTGNADKNKTLSQARATAVKNYLISKGVSAERMTAQGYGSDKPVEDNGTSQGRAKNRRVEFKIVF